MKTPDLRKCEKGDILVTVHGNPLIYVGAIRPEPYPHEIAYPDPKMGNGSRTWDGQVFLKSKLEADEDVAFILKEYLGEELMFEYYDKTLEKWVFDSDSITPALIKASNNFRYMKILRDENDS